MSVITHPAVEMHPALASARLVHSLRWCRNCAGWGRIANLLVPDTAGGAFRIKADFGWFEGDIESFVDRQVYLNGWYEPDHIRVFLDTVPKGGTVLDVGANVGTHSIAFSRAFKTVHAFEPNPGMWPSFTRNVALNELGNIALHKVGLSDRAGDVPFYLIDKKNFGLGTVSDVNQYDMPLRKAGTVRIEVGDEILEQIGIASVDAIKIDVQGLEPEVLRGLQRTLRANKPRVWVEIASGTKSKIETTHDLEALFPYPCAINYFSRSIERLRYATKLVPVSSSVLRKGDYLVVPA
jgi:FkbM family methyltransferase